MPVTTTKKNGYYENRTPSGVKGRKMSLRNAVRQANLLRAVDRGWKPTRRKGKK